MSPGSSHAVFASILLILASLLSGVGEAQAPVVQGSMDTALIRRVLHRHRGAFVRCYAERLARAPQLAGSLRVRFIIDRTGQVVSARVEAEPAFDPRLGECVAAQIRRIRFPTDAPGLTIVTWPFVFDPSPAAPSNGPPRVRLGQAFPTTIRPPAAARRSPL